MWIDYAKAAQVHQEDFRHVNPQLGPKWENYRIWLTRDGCASLRKGHWDWTDEYAGKIDGAIDAAMHGTDVRTRGDLSGFKTADFHLDRYK